MRRLSFTTIAVNFCSRAKHPFWQAIAGTVAVLFLLAGAMSPTGQQFFKRFEPKALANANKASQQQGCCADQPATVRRMIGTYYNTEDNFRSSLVLNNKGPNQIAVTPILHGKNGQTFTAPQVFVSGESSSEVDLNHLAISAGSAFRSGSFEFTYQGRMMEMGGGLRIVDANRSLIFDEQLLEPGMKFSSPQLEAVYALPSDEGRVSVIVSNLTAIPLEVTGEATFNVNGQHPIKAKLKPYESEVVELPHGLVKKAAIGAVSLKHNGEKGALMAMIHVSDEARGFSEAVNFNDPAQGKTTQWHGAGLRLGKVGNEWLTPVVAVRNIGTVATTVKARVPYAKQNGDTGTVAFPDLQLGAGEMKLLSAPLAQLKQTDFATAGVELEYTGASGSVVAVVRSVSANGNHVFALPLKDPQGGMSSTGGYPWFINGSSSTVVFIKNVTNQPQQFHLDIVYAGGRWGSNLKTLPAGQTVIFDVRKIRDLQEKGAEGNPLPFEASSGHISWSMRSKQNKTFIGRAQIVDLASGLASTYECQCFCPASYYSSRLLPSGGITGFPEDTTQCNAEQQDRMCYGAPMSWYSVDPQSISFSSDNTSAATIDSNGFATAVDPGSANLFANWDTIGWNYNPYTSGCESYANSANPYTTCAVQNCPVPTSETTIPVDWDNNVPTWYHWQQRLQPPPSSISFQGRRTYESSPNPGQDDCWFQGSARPIYNQVTNNSNQSWPVNVFNEYGPDKIGWSPVSVTYYRAQGRAPCQTAFYQQMKINCGSQRHLYATHIVGADIGVTTVSSGRAGQSRTKTY
ncbi:MAG: hypothetical protein HOP19_24470 [Acidobacteria bacterium]|nr:hypothetical protein [Acidobacteriota bacterium]